ncbi:MAG TPA: cytochrome c [Burkholderiales bacterium]|nr:cytochrome c [Burkholderiales bacterium]
MFHRFPTALVAAGLGLAALAPAALAQNATGSAAAGKDKFSICIGCHGIVGYRTAYPEVYPVPKIGGQQAAYVISALKEYKSGARWHPSMRAIAGSLSEQDMADLAAYISQVKQ